MTVDLKLLIIEVHLKNPLLFEGSSELGEHLSIWRPSRDNNNYHIRIPISIKQSRSLTTIVLRGKFLKRQVLIFIYGPIFKEVELLLLENVFSL